LNPPAIRARSATAFCIKERKVKKRQAVTAIHRSRRNSKPLLAFRSLMQKAGKRGARPSASEGCRLSGLPRFEQIRQVYAIASLPGAALLRPAPVPARAGEAPPAPASLTVTPAAFTLVGGDSAQRLLVTGLVPGEGRRVDRSRQATYASSDPRVAVVSADGVVRPRGDGDAEVRVSFGGHTASAGVTVKDYGVEAPVSFRNQVVPVFTKLGCNAGGCHGKASGQNGFKLSLLGFDPAFDYAAVV